MDSSKYCNFLLDGDNPRDMKLIADLLKPYENRDIDIIDACDRAIPILKEGDLIFIEVEHPIFKNVSATTMGWTNHVGIAFIDENDGWSVAESALPLSRRCSLYDFLNKSRNGYFSIKRVREDLTEDEVERLSAQANRRMRVFYHLGFDYDSPRQYCSKFVYEIYRDALGVEIGFFETFEELLKKNPETPLHFWKLWFFGRIPWGRRTISPQSQFDDAKLSTVLEYWEAKTSSPVASPSL